MFATFCSATDESSQLKRAAATKCSGGLIINYVVTLAVGG